MRIGPMTSATAGNVGDANYVSMPPQQIAPQNPRQSSLLHQQQQQQQQQQYQQSYQPPYQQQQQQPYQQYHIPQQTYSQQPIQQLDNPNFQPQQMSDIYARNFQYISRLLSTKDSEPFDDSNTGNRNPNASTNNNWWAGDNSRKNSFDFNVHQAVSSEGVFSFVESYSTQSASSQPPNDKHSTQNTSQPTNLSLSSAGNTAMHTDPPTSSNGGYLNTNPSNSNTNISPNNNTHHYSFGEEVDFLLDFEI